jgi:hypothetical protein
MFGTIRMMRAKTAATAAATAIVATMIGAGVAAADPKSTEVKLQSKLPVTVEVTFSGDKALQKVSPWQAAGDDKAYPVARVPEGTSVKWEAKPKNDQDKNRFTSCRGQKSASGSSVTIVISEDSCTKGTASAAPKADTSKNPAPKTDDANKKDAPKADGSNKKNDTANNKTDNKTSGTGSGSGDGDIKLTLENTMDTEAVSFRIWDQAVPGVIIEISGIAAATLNGKKWDAKNTDTISVKKDKGGKYTLDIEWHCGNRGGFAKYKDSASKIQIVKTSDGGCDLKGAAKLKS